MFYCAMRWNYLRTGPWFLLKSCVYVTVPGTERMVEVEPVDWGPQERTGRLIDLSPAAAMVLQVKTDDLVRVSCW
jgi:rare lipoprotein A (peptidoglycan hydrolase)